MEQAEALKYFGTTTLQPQHHITDINTSMYFISLSQNGLIDVFEASPCCKEEHHKGKNTE